MTHWQKILVPTDLPPDSLRAVEKAARLLQTGEAEVTLLHVKEPCFDGLRVHTGDAHRAAKKNAQQQLQALVGAHFAGHRAQVSTLVQDGRAAEGTCELARTLKADAIFIFTHGVSALKHLLMGSVAEAVVRHAPCRVLVVR